MTLSEVAATLAEKFPRVFSLVSHEASPDILHAAVVEALSDALPHCHVGLSWKTGDRGASVWGNGRDPSVDSLPQDGLIGIRQRTQWSVNSAETLPQRWEDWLRQSNMVEGILEPVAPDHVLAVFWSSPTPDPAAVAMAVEWTRPLLARSRETSRHPARSRMDILSTVLAGIGLNAPLAWVLDRIIDTLESQIPGAMAGILRWPPGIVGLTLYAPHLPGAYRERAQALYRDHPQPVAWAVAAGRGVEVVDIATDARWTELREAALQSGVRAVYFHPVVAPEGQALAAIACYFRRPYVLSSEHRGLVSACADVLRLVLAVDRARAHQQEWQAGLAHELRNQLNVMQLAADTLQEMLDPILEMPMAEALTKDSVAACLTTINDHIAVQTRLVTDLMDLARITAGRLRVDREPLLLDRLVFHEVNALKERAGGLGVGLEMSLAPSVRIVGDSARLRQVLDNLLTNALKFTPKGGRIQVELTRQAPVVLLTVRDTGVGFDPESGDALFRWFFQGSLPPVHHLPTANSGLGLALVQEIVTQHGGRIRAESAGKGLGCCMIVELPEDDRGSDAGPGFDYPVSLPDVEKGASQG
ncbi:ATP-binding protein [Sulfobacillus harzensis]|uniref:ATP-binding protein n=1 Tax=Sulfobacillus harzensis TaxID=2729629 RepID=UPI001A9B5413